MKKIKISLGLILATLIFTVACTNDKEIENAEKLAVEDFLSFGKMHNDFLTNVKENFSEVESITNENERINFINDFNKNFIDGLDISNSEKEILSSEFDKTKTYVVEDNLIQSSFGNSIFNKSSTNKNDDEVSIFSLVDDLKNQNNINDKSYEILNSLSNSLKDNYEGNLSDEQLKLNVENLIIEFNDFGYENNGEGEMVGTFLAISISSLEWWEENPDALDIFSSRNQANKSQLIAPWLAADLVGGLISGVTAAAGQAIVNGEVSLGTVGWSALAGAVSASTGAVGKIIKWLTPAT
tara:strand:- start:283 stop:1173 length:891 start_codon:yes stop_codon:yes gene_type:complete